MSGPRRLPVVGDLNRQKPQPDHTNKSSVVLMDGLPLRSTYLAKCRLCLSETFGINCTSIMDEQLSIMLNHCFRFPITFQRGLPMYVCTKCYKGVELFYRYTFQVLANQKTMEKSVIPDRNLKQKTMEKSVIPDRNLNQKTMEKSLTPERLLKRSNVRSTVPVPAKLPTTKPAERTSYGVEIIREDAARKRKGVSNTIDVDMQCEPAEEDEEDSRDPLGSYSEDIQTHFVAVPDILDCSPKCATKSEENAPFVIEIISASDEEYEVNEEDDSTENHNHERTKHGNPNTVSPTVEARSNVRETTANFTTGKVLRYGETNNNRRTNDGITSRMIDQSTINALPSRRSERNTIKQHNPTIPAVHYPRRSFN